MYSLKDCEECGGTGFVKSGNGVLVCECKQQTGRPPKHLDDEDYSGATEGDR